jgi:hypothetical protein
VDDATRNILRPLTLYITDNGRIVCDQHAGASAKATGRDISGQRVDAVTDAFAARWLADVGEQVACEDCGLKHGARTRT